MSYSQVPNIRAGPNKRTGRDFHQNIINEHDEHVPIKRTGWIFLTRLIKEQDRNELNKRTG